MKFKIYVLITFLSLISLAQKSSISELKERVLTETAQRLERVRSFADENNIPILGVFEDGSTYCIKDVVNGRPIYVTTHNVGAGRTTRADALGVGGSLGLDLDGSGVKIGIWDGGRVRPSHQEFSGRVAQLDESTSDNFHATHVAGTILSSGEFNSSSRGMAVGASAITFDFQNDDSEIIDQVRSDQSGIILSNHSYGQIVGWREGVWYGDPNISEIEDYSFGFYNGNARLWDDIAYNSPYYTILKSAGNDRGDSGDGSHPPDGPFDTIGPAGTAKNIMTIGAIFKLSNYTEPSDVRISSFSSWGPTDDGRIKPDFVAAGVSLLSTFETADDAYGSLSGTSMSAPNATGTMALLQQLHKKLYGDFMKSAALKGLVVQTIREAGAAPGPDYQHGWGLIDAKSAAKFLIEENGQDQRMEEIILNNESTYSITITPLVNTKVTATICWTDPAGTSPSPSLDPADLMLVNDLDMVAFNDTETHSPWILNPANPNNAATKGDNFRDNIEKLEFIASGESYTLEISHKGTLSSPQTLHLALSYESGETESLYWVGGTNDLDNPGNWSLESGGTPISDFGLTKKTLIFDNNSFTQSGNTISLTEDLEIEKIIFISDLEATIDLGERNLIITGDFSANDNLSVVGSGSIIFNGLESHISSEENFGNVNVLFDRTQANWTVHGDFAAANLMLNAGELTFLNGNVTLDSLESSSDFFKVISAQDVHFYIGSGFVVDNLITMDFNNSQMTFAHGGVLVGASTEINAEVIGNGDLSIEGIDFIEKLVSSGYIFIQNDMNVSELSLAPGASLEIKDTHTVTLDSYASNGTAQDLINISSESGASLKLSNRKKVCLEFHNISNVDLLGESRVTVGQNSLIENSSNWLTDDCENVLFADFEVEYNCANSLVEFINTSSGNLTSVFWTFDELGDSDDTNPSQLFAEPGVYSVSLEVEDGVTVDTYTSSIVIMENTLPANEIFANSTTLFSLNNGDAYKWLKNGIEIEGATERSYLHRNAPGSYQVVVYGESCNVISDEYVIILTSVDDQPAFIITPNPGNGAFNIRGIQDYSVLEVEVTDISGRIVFRKDLTVSQLNLNHLNPGLYFVSLYKQGALIGKQKVLLNK